MTVFSEIYAEIQNDSMDDLRERIAYAKHMKGRLQTMIEACNKAMELRRAEIPAAKPDTAIHESIKDRAVFVGVLEDRPMFEFQAQIPPAWMVQAIKTGFIRVSSGVAYCGSQSLESGDVVSESDIL